MDAIFHIVGRSEWRAAAAARVLGISPTACSTRLSRALRKLEETIGDHVAA